MKKLNQSGFTLIELLVVIAIIGLLSSIVLASLNTARSKGRDAQRLSNMRQLSNALELYRSSNNSYPNTSEGFWCADGSVDPSYGGCVGFITNLTGPLVTTGKYIGSIPTDPSGLRTQYITYLNGSSGWGCQNTPNWSYMLVFATENVVNLPKLTSGGVVFQNNNNYYCLAF